VTYTQLAALGVVSVVLADLVLLRTNLLLRRAFWVSYAIILFFQLLTNGVLTGFEIVRYDGQQIIGSDTPQLLGDGRLVFAPLEDVFFGFTLVTLTLVGWVWWGRSGVQREPVSGPPRWRSK
jgi:lycopene cyclase domain-containing protein